MQASNPIFVAGLILGEWASVQPTPRGRGEKQATQRAPLCSVVLLLPAPPKPPCPRNCSSRTYKNFDLWREPAPGEIRISLKSTKPTPKSQTYDSLNEGSEVFIGFPQICHEGGKSSGSDCQGSLQMSKFAEVNKTSTNFQTFDSLKGGSNMFISFPELHSAGNPLHLATKAPSESRNFIKIKKTFPKVSDLHVTHGRERLICFIGFPQICLWEDISIQNQ